MKPQLFVSHYRSKLQRATYIARQDKTHLAFLGEKSPPHRKDETCRAVRRRSYNISSCFVRRCRMIFNPLMGTLKTQSNGQCTSIRWLVH